VYVSSEPLSYKNGQANVEKEACSSELVIASSIQYRGHYDSNFPDHWDGTLNHGTSTTKVSTSTRQVTNNPRAELDKAAQDNSPTPASQPKRTSRTRRKKEKDSQYI
jgi:hypothetical protein